MCVCVCVFVCVCNVIRSSVFIFGAGRFLYTMVLKLRALGMHFCGASVWADGVVVFGGFQ